MNATDPLETVFKALADQNRRKILDLLKQQPHTTGNLVTQFDNIGRCAVMKHLDILYQAGLVLYRREGRRRMNYINRIPIRQIYQRWMHPLVESTSSQMLACPTPAVWDKPPQGGYEKP